MFVLFNVATLYSKSPMSNDCVNACHRELNLYLLLVRVMRSLCNGNENFAYLPH